MLYSMTYRQLLEHASQLLKDGGIEEHMMYNTFNMGLGMVIAEAHIF